MFSVAPMMDWTDTHCRYFMRLLSPSALLYTEMVTAAAIVHGDADRFLRFNEEEHPIALQLGGSDPGWMAQATAKAASYHYDEININVGCPSDRVQSGQFGACLMASPDVVAECVVAMRKESDIPITVKSRIGIDDRNDYAFLRSFIEPVAAAGCQRFVVHARTAILEGLSPKENRTIPPLNYERVYQLKRDYPSLEIIINGGLASIEQVDEVLDHVDGAMIGRQAYHQPYFLSELERHFNPQWAMPLREQVVEKMVPYVDRQLASGTSLNSVTRHMLGLFAGQPGARAWRRYISEHAHRDGAGSEVLINALNAMPAAAQAATMLDPVAKNPDKNLIMSVKSASKHPTMAEQADIHELYELSVQNVENEVEFMQTTFKSLTGRTAYLFREDFCGTASASCQWVRQGPEYQAIGVDINPSVLEWGRQNRVGKLDPEDRARVSLIESDVLTVETPKVDLLAAFNFSYFIFDTRESLLAYFRRAYDAIRDDGVFFCDMFGGPEAQEETREKTKHKKHGFTYIWHQAKFHPVTHFIRCHIHFRFKDGSKIKKAFTYEWRLWTAPEIRELLLEAGFCKATVYWEGEDEDGDGNGEFTPEEKGEADLAWIAYIIAEK